jgi:hypothetical protein
VLNLFGQSAGSGLHAHLLLFQARPVGGEELEIDNIGAVLVGRERFGGGLVSDVDRQQLDLFPGRLEGIGGVARDEDGLVGPISANSALSRP